MFLQLLNSVLYKEWSLSLGELIILSAIFNAGLFLGSLLSGIFADALGRKTVLMFGSLIQVLYSPDLFIVCGNPPDSLCSKPAPITIPTPAPGVPLRLDAAPFLDSGD